MSDDVEIRELNGIPNTWWGLCFKALRDFGIATVFACALLYFGYIVFDKVWTALSSSIEFQNGKMTAILEDVYSARESIKTAVDNNTVQSVRLEKAIEASTKTHEGMIELLKDIKRERISNGNPG